ncbi:uncharacterized protein LOC129348874 [Amphiprion ocellaris]|uniref:uncharacterized protein LOC129348874 n=1 Tax=Amphiprion ocellaris TaxID=80972 RepID=UPI00241154BD|nr:uncharacterized protein LOC129348874 [Amphiprion ocellaris]
MKRKNALYFNFNFCILKRKSNNHAFFVFQYPFQNGKSNYQIRTRTHHKPGRAKLFYIWREALQQTTASDEESSHSSGLDSATSADEADLIEGIDHSSDIIYYVGKEEDEEEERWRSPAVLVPQREVEGQTVLQPGDAAAAAPPASAPGQRRSLQLAGKLRRNLTAYLLCHISCRKGGQVSSHLCQNMWTALLHQTCPSTWTRRPSKYCF